MSKVGNTYWTKPRVSKSLKKKGKRANPATRQKWFAFALVFTLGFMLCLATNLRALSEMSEGAALNTELNSEVEKMSSENLSMQEEIHSLKNDSKTIEREARKIGMSRPNEKILVTAK